jgi:hypothetical protein
MKVSFLNTKRKLLDNKSILQISARIMLWKMSFQSLTASASLVSLAIAQASGNFISPGPQGTDGNLDGNSAISLTFQYGEPQVFAWKATISSVTLALWQNGSSPVEDTISCKYEQSRLDSYTNDAYKRTTHKGPLFGTVFLCRV